MKHYTLYLLLALLITACQKEDGITPNIGFENLYVIQDDPTDSIQHKRYEIYQTYGVPIYFNDTIGKVFIKTDINGDSVFHYEMLDLNWIFDGTNSGSVTYKVNRLYEPALQMKALHFAKIYLQNSQAALHPYAMWLTKECYQLSSSGVEKKEMISRYRNLMVSWIEQMKEKDMLAKATTYRNEVVKLKVQNYEDRLTAFNNATDKKYYEQSWQSLYPNEILPDFHQEIKWYPVILEEDWGKGSKQDSTFRKDMKEYGNNVNKNLKLGLWTDEDVDEYKDYCRKLVGAYGFVTYEAKARGAHSGSRWTPENTESDLNLYLEEMMKYPRKEFLARWTGSPLVLKKYEILYAIIRDELGVEL